MTAPPRSPRLPADLLLSFDVECGDLFPGHRVVARGLVDGGRSRDDLTSRDHSGNDECRLVSLAYELVPGVTRAEERAREPGRPFTIDATYAADVPLPWSTGGTEADGSPGPCSHEAYDEDVWGGESTLGELGPWPVPDGARRLVFWLHPVDGRRATGTVTVDLSTGQAAWTPVEPARAAGEQPRRTEDR